MKSRSDFHRRVDRKKLITKVSRELNLPKDQVKLAVMSQSLLIEQGMGTKGEWQDVYNPIRLKYIGIFKPTPRRVAYAERVHVHQAANEVSERIKAKKAHDEYINKNKSSSDV